MMKTTRRIIPLLLLVGSLTAGAEGLRKEGGEAFLEPLQKRDSVLVADQFRYGVELKDVAEGTPLALPEIQTEKDSPIEFVGDWQLDSVKVKKTGLYTIKASRILTAWWGGSYELPDIPVLFGGDTLVFKAPAEPLVVNELPVDMESFQAHDIKDQVKFPYTFKEVAPWVLGALVVIGLIYLFIQWLLHRRRAVREKEDAEPAHIKALRKLDRYRGDKYWKPDQQKLFYSGVTDALREYIVSRYGVSAMEMTTAEIFADLKGSDIPPELYQEMKALFERADFVKFAKYTATEEDIPTSCSSWPFRCCWCFVTCTSNSGTAACTSGYPNWMPGPPAGAPFSSFSATFPSYCASPRSASSLWPLPGPALPHRWKRWIRRASTSCSRWM